LIFRFGEFEVDSGRYEVRRGGVPVPVEPKVLDLLLHLLQARERLVTKEELLDQVWRGVHVGESTLTRAVSLARAALGDSAHEQRVIETVPGRGYRWKAELQAQEAAGAPRARADPASRGARRMLAAALGVPLALLALAFASWPRPLGWLLALSGAAVPPVAPALPAEPSVVVLPFRDLSPEGDGVHLAEGITEDLTAALLRFPALFVISRASAYTYEGAGVPIEAIARELGVRYAVEGSLRRSGERVVVTARLVEAASGLHVWADRIETRLDDSLDLQRRLAEQVVGSLAAEIGAAELERVTRRPTDDFGAYELFVRARAEFWKHTRPSHERARELLDRALEKDPEYELALVYRGGLETAAFLLGWDPEPERIAMGREWIGRGLALDAGSPVPHAALAMSYLAEGRGADALASARTAVELGPNSDACHGMLAASLFEQGQPLEAIAALDRALRLNPRQPELYWLLAGFLQARGGRRELAAEIFERVRAANPDIVPPRLALLAHHFDAGDREGAGRIAREILAINPGLTAKRALRIYPLALREPGVVETFRAAGLP
jgi:TolB-like protein/DNA-binding winged helix-turn-helix (wHTH) protein/Tfp pilus assembly protein PilF